MIRNRCVNDGTAESGFETRNADLLALVPRLDRARHRSTSSRRRVGLARRPHRGQRSDRAEPVPDGPHRRRAGQRDVAGHRDPFGGELVDGEVWGRGAVDMLNLTASMAVAFRHLAATGFRPRWRPDLLRRRRRGVRQRARHAVDGRPRARRDSRRLRADRERRSAQRAEGAAVHLRQRRREGCRLAAAACAGYAGSRLDAVQGRQRVDDSGRRRPAHRRLPPSAAIP